MSSSWLDTPLRYGLATRIMHWSIALLLAWQYVGMGVKIALGRESEFARFMVGTHQPIGTLLMLLIAARALWALSQWKRRPVHPDTWLGKAAAAGHVVLYVLMIYVPAVALLRAWGNTRAFSPWGISIFPERVEAIGWAVAPASASHKVLAWTLLGLIVGHVLMVVLHQYWMRDGTLAKMAGPLRNAGTRQPD